MNTTVGPAVEATDLDGDSLTHSLGGSSAPFSVVPATGQLRVAKRLNHEAVPSYSITVLVSDGKDPNHEPDTSVDDATLVTVTVEDVDEPPEISGDATHAIVENSLRLVGVYTAIDPEGDDVTWLSLTGADARYFEFDDITGELSFVDTPDYDRATNGDHGPEYRVTLQASDENDKVGDLAVTITLTNEPEPPVFSGPTEVTLNEVIDSTPGQVVSVGRYTKLDPEGEATNWGRFGETAALTGDDADAFEFDKTNGRLTFASPPDSESGGARYEVTLNANDGSLDGALDIVVNVTNLEESGSLTLGAQRGSTERRWKRR